MLAADLDPNDVVAENWIGGVFDAGLYDPIRKVTLIKPNKCAARYWFGLASKPKTGATADQKIASTHATTWLAAHPAFTASGDTVSCPD
jgi:hypothetical protein